MYYVHSSPILSDAPRDDNPGQENQLPEQPSILANRPILE